MTRRTAALAVLSLILVAGLETPRTADQAPRTAPGGPSRMDVGLPSGASLGAPAPSPRTASLVPQASPSGELTGPIYTASATWCAPTPTQCGGWGGTAELAAVHSFRWGDAPYWVRVWRGQKSADALVVSHCACQGTDAAIDLSPFVFRQLAPLSRGRIDVLVEVLGEGPRVAATAPPTDR